MSLSKFKMKTLADKIGDQKEIAKSDVKVGGVKKVKGNKKKK